VSGVILGIKRFGKGARVVDRVGQLGKRAQTYAFEPGNHDLGRAQVFPVTSNGRKTRGKGAEKRGQHDGADGQGDGRFDQSETSSRALAGCLLTFHVLTVENRDVQLLFGLLCSVPPILAAKSFFHLPDEVLA